MNPLPLPGEGEVNRPPPRVRARPPRRLDLADVVIFMLTRPRGMTVCDVVMLPTNLDL